MICSKAVMGSEPTRCVGESAVTSSVSLLKVYKFLHEPVILNI